MRESAGSTRLSRRRIEAYRRLTELVDRHWYEIPGDLRERLASLCRDEWLERTIRRGPTVQEWLSVLRLPFSVMRARLRGEDLVRDYTLARARFMVAIHLRLHAEQERAGETWNRLTEHDPAFLAAHEHGVESLERGQFVEVDWTTIPPTRVSRRTSA